MRVLKLIVLFSFFLIVLPSFSQEYCGYDYYDYECENKNAVSLNLSESDKIDPFGNNSLKGKVNYDQMKVNFVPQNKNKDKLLYQDVHNIRPQKKTYLKSFEKEFYRNTIFGSTYKTTSGTGDWSDSLSLYSKYKKDRFSFTSSYSQSKLYLKNSRTPGTISFAPEFKLNNHFSFKNVYSDNLDTRQRKSELVLSLKPFKDDRMDLSFGAGQTFSTDNQPSKSQLNFSTKFHF